MLQDNYAALLERRRLQNIKENAAFLAQINMGEVKNKFAQRKTDLSKHRHSIMNEGHVKEREASGEHTNRVVLNGG